MMDPNKIKLTEGGQIFLVFYYYNKYIPFLVKWNNLFRRKR